MVLAQWPRLWVVAVATVYQEVVVAEATIPAVQEAQEHLDRAIQEEVATMKLLSIPQVEAVVVLEVAEAMAITAMAVVVVRVDKIISLEAINATEVVVVVESKQPESEAKADVVVVAWAPEVPVQEVAYTDLVSLTREVVEVAAVLWLQTFFSKVRAMVGRVWSS